MEIPRIIHYCWFGKKEKPRLVRDCIASWREYLTDYQIIEWNESNCDLSSPFVKEMYSRKKWAFVSDYIRLEKVYEYGGIYLDTDMMVLRPFDKFLRHDCFFGAENPEFISVGIFGSIPNYPFIKKCLEKYSQIELNEKTFLANITIPRVITNIARSDYKITSKFNKKQDFGVFVIYPSAYFYPLPYEAKSDLNNYNSYVTEKTYAVHLWSSSWIVYSEFFYLRNRYYVKGIKLAFENVVRERRISFQYIKKILFSLKKSFKKGNEL